MHDVFRLDDLTNDTQHYALSHWTAIVRRTPVVPLSDMMACRRAADTADNCVLFNLDGGSIRDARIIKIGQGVAAALGIDPVGLTLSQLMPASYVSDIIPAYAFCAGVFRPLSSLDEVTYADGGRALVRRLILPLERQAPGAAFAARNLLMIYDALGNARGTSDGSGLCRQILSTHSLSVAVFRDKLD
jgi:hypothetical protein